MRRETLPQVFTSQSSFLWRVQRLGSPHALRFGFLGWRCRCSSLRGLRRSLAIAPLGRPVGPGSVAPSCAEQLACRLRRRDGCDDCIDFKELLMCLYHQVLSLLLQPFVRLCLLCLDTMTLTSSISALAMGRYILTTHHPLRFRQLLYGELLLRCYEGRRSWCSDIATLRTELMRYVHALAT